MCRDLISCFKGLFSYTNKHSHFTCLTTWKLWDCSKHTPLTHPGDAHTQRGDTLAASDPPAGCLQFCPYLGCPVLDLGRGEATCTSGRGNPLIFRSETWEWTLSQQDEWLKTRYGSLASVSDYHTNILDLTRLDTAQPKIAICCTHPGVVHQPWNNAWLRIIIKGAAAYRESPPTNIILSLLRSSCFCGKGLNSEWRDSAGPSGPSCRARVCSPQRFGHLVATETFYKRKTGSQRAAFQPGRKRKSHYYKYPMPSCCLIRFWSVFTWREDSSHPWSRNSCGPGT